ncbi:MAG: phage major capsid protein, partial [bacterium]|nr:phage major capsid protein [bacterium]
SLSASDFTAGGALIAPAFASEVIEYLRPESVVMASGPRTMDLSTGALEVPKINQGSAASYVGENQTGGITEPEFGNLVLIRKKLKAEIPVSNDLLTFATLNADAIIRDDAVAAMAQRQDAAFIRDDGTQFTPKGLRYQVPAVNVVPASGTALTNIEADLRNAALALRDKDIRMVRPGWLMSSRTELALKHIRTGTNENYAFRAEMLAGNLNGYPFKVTTQIPEDLGGGTNESELYLADWNEVVVGEAQGLRVDSSSEAAYYDGAALRSSYSRDQTVVRVIMQHDIGMRHDFGIAVVSGVLYGT